MQVCEQNTGSIALVKTTDKRRMGELKMEASVNESIKKKLMIIQRFKRGEIKKLPRADAQKRGGTRRRVMSRLRWEDCVKMNLNTVGGVEG